MCECVNGGVWVVMRRIVGVGCIWVADRLQDRGTSSSGPGHWWRERTWRTEGWRPRCVFTEWRSSYSPQSSLYSFDLGNLARAKFLWQLNASLWSSLGAAWGLLVLRCRVENVPGRWASGCLDCWLAPLPSPLASCHKHVWQCLQLSRWERRGTLLSFHWPE